MMAKEQTELNGERLVLRTLMLSDCNDRYVSWLQDEKVNQYLEIRWEAQTLDKIKKFVKDQTESPDSYIYAIVVKKANRGGGTMTNILGT